MLIMLKYIQKRKTFTQFSKKLKKGVIFYGQQKFINGQGDGQD